MAETPTSPAADPKAIQAGKPVWNDAKDVLEFKGASHPELDLHNSKAVEAAHSLAAKVLADPVAKEAVEKAHPGKDAHLILGELLVPAATPKLSKEAKEAVKKVAAAELEVYEQSSAIAIKAGNELKAAQAKAIKGINIKELEGFNPAKEDKIKEALGQITNEVKATGQFGILSTEGFGAAVKHNFSLETIKANKVKSAFKAGTAVVGVGMIYDAVAHGTRGQGDEARDRSWVARMSEGAVGVALAGGAITHGGR